MSATVTHQFLERRVDSQFFSSVTIVERNFLARRTNEKVYEQKQSAGWCSCAAATAAAVASPVGDQTRVDVAVLALVALLSDSHLADWSPQSGQEQAGDEQVGHHDGRALEQEQHKR